MSDLPKWVSSFVDRHGTRRYRFRRTGYVTQWFRSTPGTETFEAEYACFINGEKLKPRPVDPLLVQFEHMVRLGKAAEAPSYVYAVEAVGGPVKIGFSTNVRDRFRKLETAASLPLKLLAVAPGTMRDERTLHARFEDFRVRGEWFDVPPAVRGKLADLANLIWRPAVSH